MAGEGKAGARSEEVKQKPDSCQKVWSVVWTFDCVLGMVERRVRWGEDTASVL